MKKLLAAALLCPVLAFAAPTPGVPGDVRYPLRLDVDATGRVVAVDSADAVPDTLRDIVHRAAARATFVPARRGDTPVPARVWVTARVGFAPAGEKVRASVEAVTAGGGVQIAAPTRSPMRTRARGWSADVHVRATFDADGRPVPELTSVEKVAVRKDVETAGRTADVAFLDDALGQRFENIVDDTLDDWRWTPDEIDGEPIGGTFRMAVGFPSARATLVGEQLAPDAPEATFVPRPPAGLTAPALQSWVPVSAP